MKNELASKLKLVIVDDLGSYISKEIPEPIEEICFEVIDNCMHNYSKQMLMTFADGDKDEYFEQWGQYEQDDMTKLYSICNGDLYAIANDIEIVGIKPDDEDVLRVAVEFQVRGQKLIAFDLWYDPYVSNDDQDEFDHCSKEDIEKLINWANKISGKTTPTLFIDELKFFSGKYIKLDNLLDAIYDACGGDDEQMVKIQ